MTSDYEKTYDAEWRDLIEPDGKLNMDQLKRELHDYSFVMRQVSEVYCHITGNMLSKPNYYARGVIQAADEHVEELIEEALAEAGLNDSAFRSDTSAGDVRTCPASGCDRPGVTGHLVYSWCEEHRPKAGVPDVGEDRMALAKAAQNGMGRARRKGYDTTLGEAILVLEGAQGVGWAPSTPSAGPDWRSIADELYERLSWVYSQDGPLRAFAALTAPVTRQAMDAWTKAHDSNVEESS